MPAVPLRSDRGQRASAAARRYGLRPVKTSGKRQTTSAKQTQPETNRGHTQCRGFSRLAHPPIRTSARSHDLTHRLTLLTPRCQQHPATPPPPSGDLFGLPPSTGGVSCPHRPKLLHGSKSVRRFFDRAVRFYEAALDVKLNRQEIGGQPIAVFGYEEPATGGAIVHSPSMTPNGDGVLVLPERAADRRRRARPHRRSRQQGRRTGHQAAAGHRLLSRFHRQRRQSPRPAFAHQRLTALRTAAIERVTPVRATRIEAAVRTLT